MTSNIPRSDFRSFLNTGTLVSPTWTLINTGVTSAKWGFAPKTTKETYITEDTASFSVDSYAPTFPIESTAVNGDALFEYLDTKRKARSVLGDAETEIVNVYLYRGNLSGVYLAEKRSCSIKFEKFTREGGKAARLSYTINAIGDKAIGTFNPTSLTWVEADATARLSSLVFTGMTLKPAAFKANRIWYESATTDATNVITAVASAGSVAIDVDGVSVSSGDPATWAAGLNNVTVTVTNGGDASIYYIFVTKS